MTGCTMSLKFHPALFLDRDGVVNVDRGFVARREDFVWQEGIFDLVRLALARGFVPVIVTNQSGIGRGLYTLADYAALTAWMLARFAAERATIARVYHCPYHPEAEIAQYRAVHPWRKPQPGMLLAAQVDLQLDLGRSVMVGDRWSDVGAAVAAGVGNIMLVGPLSREQPGPDPPPGGIASAPAGLVRLGDMPAVVCWFAEQYGNLDQRR